ncbi:MAG: hypothetical protein H6Q14_1565 [Bacteroidetes bacterium]|nr:hypothetical protein [Bacteroidota bacterium]
MDKQCISLNGLNIYILSEENLEDVLRFVIETNYEKYGYRDIEPESKLEEILIQEQEDFADSAFYVVRDYDENIVGSIRIHKLRKGVDEKVSNELCQELRSIEYRNVCHIGRLAIKQGTDTLIFKVLTLLAFGIVCENEKNILIAECDIRLFETLRLMGINIRSVGEPYFSLGSEVVEVFAVYNDIYPYFSRHKQFINKLIKDINKSISIVF